MSEFRGSCAVCGQEVRGACARELSHAWELERSGGGAHAVQGPEKEHTGRVMHLMCHSTALFRERRGLAEGQEQLA